MYLEHGDSEDAVVVLGRKVAKCPILWLSQIPIQHDLHCQMQLIDDLCVLDACSKAGQREPWATGHENVLSLTKGGIQDWHSLDRVPYCKRCLHHVIGDIEVAIIVGTTLLVTASSVKLACNV